VKYFLQILFIKASFSNLAENTSHTGYNRNR